MLARFTLRTTVENLHTLYESRATTRGYRPVIVLWRLMAAAIWCSVIAIRFLVLDTYVLPRSDRGPTAALAPDPHGAEHQRDDRRQQEERPQLAGTFIDHYFLVDARHQPSPSWSWPESTR